MGVPLVLTAAEMAAQGFDIGVDIVLATMEEEEDVDPDAEAEFDAMMLAADNLRFAQNSRQPVNENEVNVDPDAEAEFDAMILAANNFRFAQQMRQVPSADTFQPENENEDERVPTNQPNPENDTLYGSSISQQIQNDTLHGSSIPQGGDSNTLHGSSIPQGGDNDPGSATWFKLKVPSAFQGLLQNRQIFQLLGNEVTAINDLAQGVVAVVPQSSVDTFPITPEYTSSRRILKEHGPSKLKVSGVIINKFFIKGNLWSRRRYTIDNTCHVFEWPARPVENEIQAVPPRTRARTTEELIASNAAVVASHGRVLESNAAVVESNNRLTAAIYQLISRLGESSTNRP
ncbi:uncharacterized protein LOC119331898 isoform X2 [Triticum dicoccoides]|uniref:uncharacterized protein LOC119331898 isoform X2 n=1 Tax=Triticum dicoccoides TaxID=85692 RepID=UPI001891A412|nr:uncharacterized protein LOC119331898 isoform X2 [Triticum dicoccoides]